MLLHWHFRINSCIFLTFQKREKILFFCMGKEKNKCYIVFMDIFGKLTEKSTRVGNLLVRNGFFMIFFKVL